MTSITGNSAALAFSLASAASVIILRNSEAQTPIAALLIGAAVIAYEMAASRSA